MNDSRTIYKSGKYSNAVEITDTVLRKLKGVLYEMLKDCTAVMDEHHIRYVLCGGSCLGAVRHNGFIPWDDDIDLMVGRADYENFLKIFDETLGDKYTLECPENGRNHGLSHTQMKKKGTVYKSFNELSKNKKHCGIPIDIFVMENTYNNSFLYKVHGGLCLAAGYALTCRKTAEDYPILKKHINNDETLKKAFKKKAIIGKCLKFISVDRMAKITRKIYSMCKDNQSKNISVPSGREHYFGATYPRDMVFNRRRVRFEEMKVWIPKGSHYYLRHLYGHDYMQIPRDKGEAHPVFELDFGEDDSPSL